MTKKSKYNFYAVANGRKFPVICSSWDIAKELVNGFSGAEHEGFKTLEEAKVYLKEHGYEVAPVLNERILGNGESSVYGAAEGRHSGVYPAYSSGSKETDRSSSQGRKSCETLDDSVLLKEARVIRILKRVAAAGEVGVGDIDEAMNVLNLED